MAIRDIKTTSAKISKTVRKKRTGKKKVSLHDFFGKLPHIEDGLKFQKKIRSEWG
jgi:hypothetical protein